MLKSYIMYVKIVPWYLIISCSVMVLDVLLYRSMYWLLSLWDPSCDFYCDVWWHNSINFLNLRNFKRRNQWFALFSVVKKLFQSNYLFIYGKLFVFSRHRSFLVAQPMIFSSFDDDVVQLFLVLLLYRALRSVVLFMYASS